MSVPGETAFETFLRKVEGHEVMCGGRVRSQDKENERVSVSFNRYADRERFEDSVPSAWNVVDIDGLAAWAS